MDEIIWRDPPPQKGGRPPGRTNFTRQALNDIEPMLRAMPGTEALVFENAQRQTIERMAEKFPHLCFRYVHVGRARSDVYVMFPEEES